MRAQSKLQESSDFLIDLMTFKTVRRNLSSSNIGFCIDTLICSLRTESLSEKSVVSGYTKKKVYYSRGKIPDFRDK